MEEFNRSFRGMNTQVRVVVVAEEKRQREADAALTNVEKLFARNEAVMSRFLPDSELSSLNSSAGTPFHASPTLFAVVSEALSAARATDGIFDPTVLGALLEAGYDRSFELIQEDTAGQRMAADLPPSQPCRWQQIEMDPRRRAITLPKGCGLDLGGIGKGWTVDRAVDSLRLFPDFAVDAGGDLYAAGTQPDGSSWSVGVEDPFHPDRDLLVLEVADRAVATSTVSHRRWQKNGRQQHHLIDPRTGRPAESGVVAATVLADSVAQAELLAKVVLLLGPQGGQLLLQKQPGAEGLLVLATGELLSSPGFVEATHAA